MSVGASKLEHEQGGWLRAHEELSRLAHERARADAEEGRWLLQALRSGRAHAPGFWQLRRVRREAVRLQAALHAGEATGCEALEGLPVVSRALEAGDFNWSCARELSRVAVAETEREWLEVARGKTVHQVEALVAGKAPGDKPSSPRDSSARRHVLRFEVTPETLALFREAVSDLRRSSGTRPRRRFRAVADGAPRPRRPERRRPG